MLSVEEMERRIEARGSEGRVCTNCVHLNVCAVYRAVAPLLNSFEERKPLSPVELAKICKEYMPVIATPTRPR